MPDPATPAADPAKPAAEQSILGGAGGTDAAKPDAQPATTGAKDAPPANPATTPAATPEINLTVPKDSGLSEDEVKAVTDFAKANGLTQAQAEKVLEREVGSKKLSAEQQKTQAEKAEKERVEQGRKFVADSIATLKSDPDFGGKDGAKYGESINSAKRVIDKFADPDLKKFLEVHPLGSDPLVLKFLARVGSLISEDGTLGGQSSPGKSSAPESIDAARIRIYGK